MIAQVMLTHDAFLFQSLFRAHRVLCDMWDRWFAKARVMPPVVIATLERFRQRESPQQDVGLPQEVYHALDMVSAAQRSPALQTNVQECSLVDLERFQPSLWRMAAAGQASEWKPPGSHSRSLWGAGVLRPQAGVEIDMPLPDIGQTGFDMVLMFWNMWQHVSRL